MQLKCPRCGTSANELIECEVCKNIGCIRCITKNNKQWICEKCKNGYVAESPESVLSAMFG